MGYATFSDRTLKVLTSNPGKVIYRDDIAEDTGLTLDQVTTTMRRVLTTKFAYEIDVVIRGRAWRYHPNRSKGSVVTTSYNTSDEGVVRQETPKKTPISHPVGDDFERVGRTDDGEVVVKDKRGTLFKVVRL